MREILRTFHTVNRSCSSSESLGNCLYYDTSLSVIRNSIVVVETPSPIELAFCERLIGVGLVGIDLESIQATTAPIFGG